MTQINMTTDQARQAETRKPMPRILLVSTALAATLVFGVLIGWAV